MSNAVDADLDDGEAAFRNKPLEVYEDEIFDKAIYPGRGTGDSNALAYTLAGRINELGEYCEKFLPVVIDALHELQKQQSPENVIPIVDFTVIVKNMIAVGKAAHSFKKPLRKGITKMPPFRAFTPMEHDDLDGEDGDTWWYQGAHTSERAGKRSWARVIWRNIMKLAGRLERNTIEGDGDKR